MTILHLKPLLFTLALLAVSPPASADEKADRLLREVEAKIASLQILTVDLSGSVRDQRPDRTPLTTFTGKACMKRPNLARIDYQQVACKEDGAIVGKRSVVVAVDGKMLWKFEPQKSEYRKYQIAPDGGDIFLSDAPPLDGPIYLFFHARIPHTNAPPTYLGEETWQGRSYRVIEFREGAGGPTEPPQIRQRLYIGSDNLIHRFVNEQLKGKYVEECAIKYLRAKMPMSVAKFAYSPPPGAKEVTPPPPPMLAVGTPAPDLTVEDQAGKPLKLSDLRGKVVVLDFWTLGCGHCIDSRSHLNAVAGKFADNAVVLALNVEDTKEALGVWLSKHPEYAALRFARPASPAEKEKAMILYQIPGFPLEYVIGKDGKIVKGFLGYGGPTPALENAIRAAGGATR